MTTLMREAPPIAAAEQFFSASDGIRLFYRAWTSDTARHAVIVLHRGHEHSGRMSELAEKLADERTAVFAWDARGHGRSPGERGHADSFAVFVRDLDEFVKHVSRKHGIAVSEMAIVAHSVGAVIAAAWVHDYAPPIRAMVLATPAFAVKLYVPFALPALRMLNRVKRKAFIKSYVKASMLTHDPEQARAYASDPLISRQIAVNILIDLADTSRRLLADAGAITVPTLILSAGSDWVVKRRSQQWFFDRLSSRVKRMISIGGMSHALFHETQRDRVSAKTREFIVEAFESGNQRRSLLDADEQGYTKREHDRLRLPSRNVCYPLQRMFLKSVGRLSEGIRIGWQHGFNSGRALDHVYENRAQGVTPLGKLIDRMYLNAVGWRGIRRRKLHLEQLLRRAIGERAAKRAAVHVVDIASGPGRYLLDVMQDFREQNVHATCRDRGERELARGRALAAERKLDSVRYEIGDGFDPKALATISPAPDVGIVSGLYELFGDNGKVLASLRGLAAGMTSGSLLIYTNQPWHPRLEMIARVLDGSDGRRWVMRRRTQAEMDELVRVAGFEKQDMLIDDDGIFTVSLARRV